MAQIQVKFDPTLDKRTIEMPLQTSSPEEAGESYTENKVDVMQTSVFGVLVPLVKINNTIIDFDGIYDFRLESAGPVPTVSVSFIDKYDLVKHFSTPSNDNYMIVQILPPFDEAYKKINLEFYISKIDIYGNDVTVQGAYKVPKLTESQFKAMGQVNTYELCSTVAKDSGLGFATNVENPQDSRWVYCNHTSYLDTLNHQIQLSGGSPTEIYDFWVDFWDYINLVNVYERYNSIDSEEDMQIWIGDTPLHDITEGHKITPYKTHCALTNNPVHSGLDFSIIDYSINNNSGIQMGGGTDHVYSIYDKELGEYKDVLVQDGDVKQDVFVKYEYVGETNGDYNYFLAEKLRQAYLQKMNSESLEVILNSPMLGIPRGSKVDVLIYENDTNLEMDTAAMKEAGALTEPETNIPVDDGLDDEDFPEGQFRIQKNLSGQYYVLKTKIEYDGSEWRNTLTLIRPASSKYDPLKEELDKNNNPKTNANMSIRPEVEGERMVTNTQAAARNS